MLYIILSILSLIPPIIFTEFAIFSRTQYQSAHIILINGFVTFLYPTSVIVFLFYALSNLFSGTKSWFVFPAKLGIIAGFVPLILLIFSGFLGKWEWCCPVNPVIGPLFWAYVGFISLMTAMESREKKFLSGIVAGVFTLSWVFLLSEIMAFVYYLENFGDIVARRGGGSPWDRQSVVAFLATPFLFYLRFLFDIVQFVAIGIGVGLGVLLSNISQKLKRNTTQSV